MSKYPPIENGSLKFATDKSVLSPADRLRTKRYTPRKLGLVALSAATVFAAYNSLEKMGKIEPASIQSILSKADYIKLTEGGLKGLENITLKGQVNIRNSCGFENGAGEPLNNLVTTTSPNSILHFPVVIEVSGQSANINKSQSDEWFVAPIGHGDEAVCFDASELIRENFGSVTTGNGESALGVEPNANLILKNNTVYFNNQPVPSVSLSSQ